MRLVTFHISFFLPSFPFLSAPFAYSIPSRSASVMQLISCVCALKRHSGDSPGIHQQRHSVVPNTVIVPIQFPTLSCWHDKMPADHTGTIKTHLLCWFRRNPNRHVQVFIVGTVDISATVIFMGFICAVCFLSQEVNYSSVVTSPSWCCNYPPGVVCGSGSAHLRLLKATLDHVREVGVHNFCP